MKLFWLYVGLVVSFSLVRFIVDREEKENEEKPRCSFNHRRKTKWHQ